MQKGVLEDGNRLFEKLWNRHSFSHSTVSPRIGRLCAVALLAVQIYIAIPALRLASLGFVRPASAQVNTVGQAMCGTGLGQLVGVSLAAISLYLIVKGVFRGAMAFDKMGSSRSETQFEGKRKLVGAGKTTAGAFVPPMFGAMLEMVGVNTISCIDFTTGLLGTIVVFPF